MNLMKWTLRYGILLISSSALRHFELIKSISVLSLRLCEVVIELKCLLIYNELNDIQSA